MSSPFTAKGSTGQMIPEIGNFMYTTKATLVPNGYDSVKKNKPHENSSEGEYFIGMSLARKTIL